MRGKPLVPWVIIALGGIVLMLSLSFHGLVASQAEEVEDGEEVEEIVIDDPIAAGEEIYQSSCLGCHGASYDQIGSAPLNAFTADDKDHIIDVVTNGKGGGMPAFGSQLQDVQIDAIAEFLISISE